MLKYLDQTQNKASTHTDKTQARVYQTLKTFLTNVSTMTLVPDTSSFFKKPKNTLETYQQILNDITTQSAQMLKYLDQTQDKASTHTDKTQARVLKFAQTILTNVTNINLIPDTPITLKDKVDIVLKKIMHSKKQTDQLNEKNNKDIIIRTILNLLSIITTFNTDTDYQTHKDTVLKSLKVLNNQSYFKFNYNQIQKKITKHDKDTSINPKQFQEFLTDLKKSIYIIIENIKFNVLEDNLDIKSILNVSLFEYIQRFKNDKNPTLLKDNLCDILNNNIMEKLNFLGINTNDENIRAYYYTTIDMSANSKKIILLDTSKKYYIQYINTNLYQIYIFKKTEVKQKLLNLKKYLESLDLNTRFDIMNQTDMNQNANYFIEYIDNL
jgi:hypothetical protein